MPKKKKTLKQKILADMRQKVVKIQPLLDVAQLHEEKRVEYKSRSPIQVIATSNYQHLSSDLFNTIVLTISIIAGELVLGHLFA